MCTYLHKLVKHIHIFLRIMLRNFTLYSLAANHCNGFLHYTIVDEVFTRHASQKCLQLLVFHIFPEYTTAIRQGIIQLAFEFFLLTPCHDMLKSIFWLYENVTHIVSKSLNGVWTDEQDQPVKFFNIQIFKIE